MGVKIYWSDPIRRTPIKIVNLWTSLVMSTPRLLKSNKAHSHQHSQSSAQLLNDSKMTTFYKNQALICSCKAKQSQLRSAGCSATAPSSAQRLWKVKNFALLSKTRLETEIQTRALKRARSNALWIKRTWDDRSIPTKDQTPQNKKKPHKAGPDA